MDDPRYEGFAGKNFVTAGLPRERGRAWQKIRLSRSWKPPEVSGRVRKFNDFPGLGLMPAFSERAVVALRDLLEPNGELLPLETPLGYYFVYNVTTIVDALDVAHSEVRWINKPFTALKVERYAIIPKKIEGHPIFHLPETASQVYVTDVFLRRALEHELHGMDFQKVWPLPPSVDWSKLARAQRDKEHGKGLGPGLTIKGNTVVIRLFLSKPTSKRMSGESQAAETLMNDIDSTLFDVNATEPPIGSLEGHDFGVPGELRIFISCPDADALVIKLRPWLRKLEWPNGLAVIKRYGNIGDRAAKEEVVKI